MLQRLFCFCGLLALVVLLLSADISCSPSNVKASLGKEFTLPVGRTAVISSDNITLEFVGIISDNRCSECTREIANYQDFQGMPPDLNRAGIAYFRVKITRLGKTEEDIFSQPSEFVFSQPDMFTQSGGSDFEIDYRLEPSPQIGKQISRSDYRLRLVVKIEIPPGPPPWY